MTPNRRRIDDRQLDEALRTIAAASAPVDLPARVLDAIHREAPAWWWPTWRPALGVALGVMAIALIAVWMHAPVTPREAQGSRRTAQDSAATDVGTSAPQKAQGSGRMAQGMETSHLRISAPPHLRTSARPAAQGSGPTAQVVARPGIEEVPPLDLPEPLTIARLQPLELSEDQLQVNALHVPALEVETLEH